MIKKKIFFINNKFHCKKILKIHLLIKHLKPHTTNSSKINQIILLKKIHNNLYNNKVKILISNLINLNRFYKFKNNKV